MISEEWHQRLKKLRKAAGMTVPCTCTALLFSFLAAGLGGLSRGALDDERLEGTRNIAQTALFAVLTANAVVAPYMGESVLRTTQRLLGNVVGTLIFIWVALYQQRWLVLITIPIYAFIVCAARYSIFVVDGEYGSYQSLTLSFSVALLVERSHAYIVAAATWRTTGLCLGILSMSLFLTMIPNASTKEARPWGLHIGDKLGDALRGLAKLTNTLAQSNEQLAALAEEEKAAFDQEEAFFESVDPTADADDDAEEGDEEGSGDGEGDGDGEEQDVEDEMPLSRAERVALLKADVVKQAAAVGKLIRQVNSLLVNTGYEIYVGTVFGTRLFLPLPRRGTGIPVGPVVQVTARMAELLHLLSGLQGDLEALSGVGKAGRHRGAGGGNREALLQAYGGADVAAEALAAAEKALEVGTRPNE
ncbi:hypothetical protein MNEG_1439 [Monoraphidium neglectum]|uniref:Integral membrane bound transporter domain-containing protein n=1 Tax=Monoraphidium neglectum TaxID=145388 RepID=A0A0D2MVE9_9CHLO|nr:hypothetical protein MNEG_1439 [Monoraphidium neglectum]KIZ06510.1 hypothetical protein MNEG_1439 [Monoraphidium neglectum]|eukprot:XP_013905529.1 hypothetical protein MNEG_1439 [Monoraphidium neglectum]